MKSSEDISPWGILESIETKQNINQYSLAFPKLTSSTPIPTNDKIQHKQNQNNPTFLATNDLRHSLQMIRNQSVQHGFIRSPNRSLQKQFSQRQNKNQFKPSYSLATLKKNSSPSLKLTVSHQRDSSRQSTPFIKSRMQALLKNYQVGLNTCKYIKNPVECLTVLKMKRIQAKKKDIQFVYNSAAKPIINPQQKARRTPRIHILDTLLGRWQ